MGITADKALQKISLVNLNMPTTRNYPKWNTEIKKGAS